MEDAERGEGEKLRGCREVTIDDAGHPWYLAGMASAAPPKSFQPTFSSTTAFSSSPGRTNGCCPCTSMLGRQKYRM